MRRSAINFRTFDAGGGQLARKFWEEAGHGREPRDLRRGTKGSVAAEKFVAAQAGERHFQSRLACRPGNEISIDSVHAGLIERGDGFIEARFHVTARESHLAMFGPQALGSLARDFRFAEFGVGEGNSESVNAFLHVAGQRGNGRRVQAATEKHANGNVRDQVTSYSILEERTNGGGGGGEIFLVCGSAFSVLVLIKLLSEIPVKLWLGHAARVVRVDFHEMSGRKGENAFDHGHGLTDGAEQQI